MSAVKKLSPEQLQTEIQNIQQDFQKKLVLASSNPNPEEITRLAEEMNHKITVLMSEHEKAALEAVSTPTPVYSYANPMSQYDLNSVVNQNEKNHYSFIIADPVLVEVSDYYKQAQSTASFHSADAHMAKHALKLEMQLAPTVAKVVAHCQQVLKLNTTPLVYLTPSREYNAFALPSAEGTIKIGLTSAVLEDFDGEELATVIGHEIAHVLLGHTKYPFAEVLRSGHLGLTPVHAMRLFAWRRSAEISADRIGVLCGGSFEKSARALFRVSFGLNIESDEVLHAYLKQMDDDAKGLAAMIEPQDFFTTHPISSLRLMALSSFVNNPTFKSGTKFSVEEAEQRTTDLLKLFESSYLNNPENLQAEAKEFFFLGGVCIGLADGNLAVSEVSTLAGLLKRPVEPTEINAIISQTPEERYKTLQDLSQKMLPFLTEQQRLMIIRDLCYIAMADGVIQPTEVDVLAFCGRLLAVHPAFINSVLTGTVQ
jgi:uncharacterized tellurite resistance protein B-like protein